jgi:hypothetical protein
MKPIQALVTSALTVCPVGAVGYANDDTDRTASCGELSVERPFGETDFAFRHNAFQDCAALVPPGVTVIDVVMILQSHKGDAGDSYNLLCQCKEAGCGGHACNGAMVTP